MRKKRIVSLLLVLILALTLTPPAGAASAGPWVTVTGQGSSKQSLTLMGVAAGCYGVELTLKLSRSVPDPTFTPDASLSGEGCYAVCRSSGNKVTIYVTSDAPLNVEKGLRLGVLSAGQGFSTLSAESLKTVDLRSMETAHFTNLPLKADEEALFQVSVRAGIENGTVSLSTGTAKAGEAVTVTVSAQTGYTFTALKLANADGEPLAAIEQEAGRYVFRMPASDVEVGAEFSQSEKTPFSDVGDTWYTDSVAYVCRTGLMYGTGEGKFSPGRTTTRAMIVTLLHRLEGLPEAGTSRFEDVPAGQYYTAAVNWAAENKIVEGKSETRFAPNDNITREQLATILYRYAQYKGLDVQGRSDLSKFADSSAVSSWAVDALGWTSAAGLVKGVEGNRLNPGGNASRAETATVFMRLCDQILRHTL